MEYPVRTFAADCYTTEVMAFANPASQIDEFGLSPGAAVADFGAGAGHLAVAAAEAVGEDGTVYVIDIQRDLLTKARHVAQEHHLKTLVFIHGDLEAPNGSTLPDTSVDAVLIANVLFQVEDAVAVLREARRILRPKGRVMIVDWRESYGGMGPQPEHVFGPEQARSTAKEVGFTEQRELDAGDYHYGIVFST